MKKVLLFFIFLTFPFFSFAADRVEINTAPLQQLEEIIGIGPVLAQRIMDDRPFSSVDDLLRVKGIGEKTLQKIKAQGIAYVVGQPQQPAQEINPTPTPTTSSIPIPTPSPTPMPNITYPEGIFINEILPSPEGADETNEWIELYNKNNFDINLSDWKIQDTQGTTTTYILPKDAKILANGYLVLNRPDTKIILNNENDGLNLMLPDDKIIDSVSYNSAPKNQSYNKKGVDWQWSTTLTPGFLNNITSYISIKEIKALSKSKNSDNKSSVSSAALSQPINSFKNSLGQEKEGALNPLFLFLTIGLIIIILAIIILILKLKGFKKSNT